MFLKILLHLGDLLLALKSFGNEILMFFDSIAVSSHKLSVLVRSVIHSIRYNDNETFYHILLTIIVIAIICYSVFFWDKD
ncbi:hypothetical protein OAO85_00610 [Candidatus Pelagibacter sp.]|nr:hypothetical protein [Candidatus Pelagibacter sp.]